jgi:peroxiredoxin
MLALWLLGATACSHDRTPAQESVVTASSSTGAAANVRKPEEPDPAVLVRLMERVGKPAPDFALKDIDGRRFRLADYRGSIVVLEWFNPKCPFVNASHTKGSLKGGAAHQIAQGVEWFGVDSAAPGKQGSAPDDIRDAVKRFGLTYPVLRDESGAVGHAYAATNTPHMFVIDREGVLVYAGAIDNSPDGEGESPQGGPLVNYVDAAIADITAGRAVRTPQTKPYGCTVKYGS